MSFCTNCGHEVDSNAKYCPECGSPINSIDNASKRQVEFAGKIIKCPNCGEILNNPFSIKCPACGYELRGANSFSTVKNLEQELKKIEAQRQMNKDSDFLKTLIGSVDQQLANKITNFTIPNTKEDIFEFMILAASNIDPTVYSKDSTMQLFNNKKIMISNAWDSKYNQAHQKAKLMFPDDTKLLEIEKLYKSKKKEIYINKHKDKWLLIGILIFFVVFVVFVEIMLLNSKIKESNLERELNATVTEIEEDISNGDYDSALYKANGLRFDASLDKAKAEQWDEQRENIIEIINEKKGGN